MLSTPAKTAIVSTMKLSFLSSNFDVPPYETYVYPIDGSYVGVVERYNTEEEAIKGHNKWVAHYGGEVE